MKKASLLATPAAFQQSKVLRQEDLLSSTRRGSHRPTTMMRDRKKYSRKSKHAKRGGYDQ